MRPDKVVDAEYREALGAVPITETRSSPFGERHAVTAPVALPLSQEAAAFLPARYVI
jgi:hypothetical protein